MLDKRLPYSKELMEPASSREGDRWRHDNANDGSTQSDRSAAISLKRIADTLDKIKESITYES